ncbi:MAG: phage major capsid protein [Deltaproteobacteria bacterium]|nr:phage major capsid protein [Deltaproteobacteria bacterium]
MKDYQKMREQLALLKDRHNVLNSKKPLNGAETDLRNDVEREMKKLEKELNESTHSLTNIGPQGALRIQGPGDGYALAGPKASKQYRDLFGKSGHTWKELGGDDSTGFFSAVLSGRHHPGLKTHIQNMRETVPGEGGFLVPVEYASKIHEVALEDELIMPRCYVQPMRSNELKIPGMAIGDHSTALMGGFVASYVSEAGTISEADPKLRQVVLNCKKLTGLLRFSSELTEDAPGGESQLMNICGKGLAWYRDKAFLKGSGAGEPLGILNAGCTVEVAPEGGQAADTIVYANLTNMMAHMYAGSFKNSVWICHQSTIPQLLTLSLEVGVGGSRIPVMQESSGEFKILTRPVIFTEKTEVLGDKGDILLADLSQYVVGLRNGMRFDTSIHVHFSTDELLGRIIERHDGMPLWNEPLTLADGTTEVSPFVVLGERT